MSKQGILYVWTSFLPTPPLFFLISSFCLHPSLHNSLLCSQKTLCTWIPFHLFFSQELGIRKPTSNLVGRQIEMEFSLAVRLLQSKDFPMTYCSLLTNFPVYVKNDCSQCQLGETISKYPQSNKVWTMSQHCVPLISFSHTSHTIFSFLVHFFFTASIQTFLWTPTLVLET